MPCCEPGLRPVSTVSTCTASPFCVKVTVPRTSLPRVGSSFATALGPEAPPIDEHAATRHAATPAASSDFITSPPGGRSGGLLRLLGRFHCVGLGFRLAALGGRGCGGDRLGLRHRLAHLLHVR